jgi:hypothetical protein
MAKIELNNASLILGVRDNLSGSLINLKFSKNGRIELKDKNVYVKRPGQYKKKMQ